MKSIFLKLLSFWLLFSGNLFASSEKILFYYDILKEMPKSDVVDKGKVCEKIAMLQIASEYSDEKFEIIPNIVYGFGNVVLGELDLLVVDKKDRKVVKVLEIKCQKNLRKSSKKAKVQLERIKSFISDHHEDVYLDVSESIYYVDSDEEIETDEILEVTIEAELESDQVDFYIQISMKDEVLDSYGSIKAFDEKTKYVAMSPVRDSGQRYGFEPLTLTMSEVEILTDMLQKPTEKQAKKLLRRKTV